MGAMNRVIFTILPFLLAGLSLSAQQNEITIRNAGNNTTINQGNTIIQYRQTIIASGDSNNIVFMQHARDTILALLNKQSNQLKFFDGGLNKIQTTDNKILATVGELKKTLSKVDTGIEKLSKMDAGISQLVQSANTIQSQLTEILADVIKIPEILDLTKDVLKNVVWLKDSIKGQLITALQDYERGKHECKSCNRLRKDSIGTLASFYASSGIAFGFLSNKTKIIDKMQPGLMLSAGITTTTYFGKNKNANLLIHTGFVYGNFNYNQTRLITKNDTRTYTFLEETIRYATLEIGAGTNLQPFAFNIKNGWNGAITLPVEMVLGINCWSQYINYPLALTESGMDKVNWTMGGVSVGLGCQLIHNPRGGVELNLKYTQYYTNYYWREYSEAHDAVMPFEHLNSLLGYGCLQIKAFFN